MAIYRLLPLITCTPTIKLSLSLSKKEKRKVQDNGNWKKTTKNSHKNMEYSKNSDVHDEEKQGEEEDNGGAQHTCKQR